MHQVVRITCGAIAAAAMSACVVVPAHRSPPPSYGAVVYRAEPPPPPPEQVEYRRVPPPPPEQVEYRRVPPPPPEQVEYRRAPPPPPSWGAALSRAEPPPPPPPERVEYRRAPPPERVEFRFHDRQRELAREYYKREYHDRGRCPPGLERKHRGCERPRHEAEWERGKPLPRDVEVHAVPRDLEVRIGAAPRGYRYVQVAGDILMIAVGTAVVVDAIQDLNR